MIYLRQSTNGDLAIVENEQDGVDKTYKLLEEGDYTVLGPKTITENGKYEAKDDEMAGYSEVTVNVPEPSGKIEITENGNNIDIAQYAKADVNVGTEWRNFTLSIEQDSENWIDSGYVCVPYYNEDDQLEILTDAMNEWPDLPCKLPVVNGKCQMLILWNLTQLTLQEGSTGCSLTQAASGWYTLTIAEDDAIVLLFASQVV